MNPVASVEARPFTFGGSVRLLWINPTDAAYDHVIVLRKSSNSFSGPTDPSATVAYKGVGRQASEFRSVFLPDDVASSDLYRTILDDVAGWNTTVYYAIYASNAAETVTAAAVVVAAALRPVSTFEELDVIGALIPFIGSYLNEQIATGALKVPNGVTAIDVVDGPPLLDGVQFPIVSLHLDADTPTSFAIGDNIGHLDDDGDNIVARRGFMSTVTIAIVGVTPNPEVRRFLYRSLKAALIAARELLEKHGLMNMEVSGRFTEDFINYDMPLFAAEMILRGAVATSVTVPPAEGIITEIDVYEGVLTPQEIDP